MTARKFPRSAWISAVAQDECYPRCVASPAPSRESPADIRRPRRALIPLLVWILVALLLAYLVFRHFLLDFAVAAAVALFLGPVHRRLTKVLRGWRAPAAALLVLLTALVILVPAVVSATILGRQAVAFFEWAGPSLQPEALQHLLKDTLQTQLPWLTPWLGVEEASTAQIASETLSRLTSALNRVIQRTVTGLTSAFFDLFLFLLILFFLLRDGGSLRQEVRGVSPLSGEQEDQIIDHLIRTVKGMLLAMILVPIGQGLLSVLGFLAFGVPSPLLWGAMVVLAALVPLLGSPLAWVPACVYLFVRGETWQWAGLLVFGLVVISGIDNFVKPMILRDSAQIHPLLGFLAILGGIFSFGPVGFLVGPVILSLALSALRIYRLDILGARREGS